MATILAMLESKATTAEKLILMLRQQIGEARAAQVVLPAAVLTKLAPHEFSHITGRAPEGCLSEGSREAEGRQSYS